MDPRWLGGGQEMALDLDDSTARQRTEEEALEPGLSDSLIYSQDVKCFHCGFVSGQLVGHPTLPREARTFSPTPGQQSQLFEAARLRCFRCGGPCFLDEVETTVRLREEDLEKPRRGRKPKARPDAVALP